MSPWMTFFSLLSVLFLPAFFFSCLSAKREVLRKFGELEYSWASLTMKGATRRHLASRQRIRIIYKAEKFNMD